MIETQGGATIEGSVEVGNGHFIGRDFIQTITNIIQGGEDPEEAKSVIALYLRALTNDLAIPGLKLSDLREVLEELAFKVHEQNVGREGTADIAEHRVINAFRPLLNNSRDKADVVVDYIEKRAGLLIGQGERDNERQFTLPARTFQEFLAASHLAAQDDFPAKCARLARTAAAHWQVTLPLAARLAKTERGASAADELIGTSSAVGCFPPNGYDLYDMIGNVWEWTRSVHGFEYPYDPDDRKREDRDAGDKVLRVVRGSSWLFDRDNARCAFRLRSQPDLRYDGLGFRVVLRCAPVP